VLGDSQLGILSLDAGRYEVTCAGRLPQEVLAYVRELGGVTGATVLAHFGGPPHGVPSDTLRAVVVGLLRAGKVRVEIAGKGEITSAFDEGARELLSDGGLRKARLGENTKETLQPRDRAAICTVFKDLLGKEVARDNDAITDAVVAGFAQVRERLTVVATRFRELPKSARYPAALGKLETLLERCRAVARTVRQVLLDEIQNNYLAAENQASAKAALRGLYEFNGLVADIDGGVHHHPYELYRALRSLSIDVCVFRGIHPAESERPYSHEDLAVCFDAVLSSLEEQVQISGQRIPYVEFKRREGMLVCELTGEARRAKDFFLLVQKPQVATKADLSRIKLASESRIHTVYERALRGIPIQRLDNPPFFRGISANVEFFAITAGQEWDYAIREGLVVLFDGPHLEGLRLYVYWRAE
jgi:type VI secretion system protein ImpJ